MTCDECRNLLQELVDAETGPAEKSALEAHLTTCVECARLHRQLSKFTTSMLHSMRSLRPEEDFSSKVLARYEESKTELQRVSEAVVAGTAAPGAARSYPVWPFAAGIGLVLVAGLALLLGRPRAEELGALRKGRDAARILEYQDGAWREVAGRAGVLKGDRVEAVEAPGMAVEIDFEPLAGVQAFLRSPCGVQVDRVKGTLILYPLPENPGRIHLRTTRAPGTSPIKAVQIKRQGFNAWAELRCGEENAADIEPGPAGELIVSVRKGSARLGNTAEDQQAAEGYTRTVPPSGPCSAAVQVKAGAFDWLGER